VKVRHGRHRDGRGDKDQQGRWDLMRSVNLFDDNASSPATATSVAKV
jgi:hypothetical protein